MGARTRFFLGRLLHNTGKSKLFPSESRAFSRAYADPWNAFQRRAVAKAIECFVGHGTHNRIYALNTGMSGTPGRKDLRRVLMIGFSHGQDIIAQLSVLREANLRGTLRVGGTGDQALGGSPIRNVRDGRRAALKGSAKELPQAALNSLWGAALVQGMMFVARLRQKFPGVPVTETHPKATAVALGGWESPQIQAFGCPVGVVNHMRDAYLSAVAAREGFSGRWRHDLSLNRDPSEQDPRARWLAPVHYFWPVG
jgi:hypothetical protein